MNIAAAKNRACIWKAAPVRCKSRRPQASAKKADKRERGIVRLRLVQDK